MPCKKAYAPTGIPLAGAFQPGTGTTDTSAKSHDVLWIHESLPNCDTDAQTANIHSFQQQSVAELSRKHINSLTGISMNTTSTKRSSFLQRLTT